MHVLKRGPILKNYIIYLILSQFFLYILFSLNNGVSFLEKEWLWSFFKVHKLDFTLMLFSIIAAFFLKRISLIFSILYFVVVFFYQASIFFDGFNKIVLLGSFFHIVITFAMLQIWVMEFKSAAFCPNYSINQLIPRRWHNIGVSLATESGKILWGNLTNWDRESCFIRLKEQDESILDSQSIKVRVSFGTSIFESKGSIVSKYYDGIGIKWGNEKQGPKKDYVTYDWNDFVKIVDERGLRPISS